MRAEQRHERGNAHPRALERGVAGFPQVIASVGNVIALWYITPPAMNPSDIYLPLGTMPALPLACARGWSALVQREAAAAITGAR